MNGNVVDIKDKSKKTGKIIAGVAVAVAALIVVLSSAAESG